ncbi:hypothetical protein M3I54_29915 [Paraburkholderia sp. CNPSo 3274]|uniref:hypothetical protein n=1 Tax=Paraburkholderia sp. CNPSo 3274 TaxID=2940932 RepID=UPI0020B75284|nr:hypothetical protein [Paraburkholderia sp. CNPSo 3274]MCP3711142.1 hypothetical protein [Paraburkholderia sp. CNPSo 3274]
MFFAALGCNLAWVGALGCAQNKPRMRMLAAIPERINSVAFVDELVENACTRWSLLEIRALFPCSKPFTSPKSRTYIATQRHHPMGPKSHCAAKQTGNIVEPWFDLSIRQRRNDGRRVDRRSLRIVRLEHLQQADLHRIPFSSLLRHKNIIVVPVNGFLGDFLSFLNSEAIKDEDRSCHG